MSGRYSAAEAVLSQDTLHLILMPTEACNFRCVYCYEDFQLGRMSDEIVGGVEALLSTRVAALNRLEISWFGGEPLLAETTILRILKHVASLRQNYPQLAFHSDMTTNGYRLDGPLLEALCRLGVSRYQISFDGWADSHDRKRIRAGGGPTFDRLWANMIAARALPLSFTAMLRLHVERENFVSCQEFIRELGRTFEGDPRFPLYLKLLSRWGGPNDATLPTLDRSKGAEVLEELRAEAKSVGVPIYESDEKEVCYAARGNSFLIRSDGRVNKCTLALNAPENQVGRLTADGKLLLSATRMVPWMRGLWEGSEATLHCPKQGLVGVAV